MSERAQPDEFRVGGLLPLTTVEWEGRLAAVLFAQGCPWRCRYCHNTSLVPRQGKLVPWPDVLSFLTQRQGLLDAVVFSGGEPTQQASSLPAALTLTREMGFLTALHTNGYRPEVVQRLLAEGLVDHVAMDVKAPWDRYERVTRIATSGRRAQRSVMTILQSGVPYEFRTTFHSDLLSEEEVLAIAEDLAWRGAETYFLQRYRTEGSGDMPLALADTEDPSPSLLRKLRRMFRVFGVRG